MDKLVDNLYNLSLSLDSSARSLYETERQDAAKLFQSLMEKTDTQLREKLHDAGMEYLAAEQYHAFYLGLRLGLQLHAL